MGLWRKVVWTIHSGARSWSFIPGKLSLPGPWKQITNIYHSLLYKGVNLKKAIVGKVNSGKGILFWTDVWWGESSLAELFPILYQSEKNKHCMVSDRIIINDGGLGFNWAWDVNSGESEFVALINGLETCLGSVFLGPQEDGWACNLGQGMEFKVADIKRKIERFGLEVTDVGFLWCKWVPKKVNIVGWRVFLDRLPTVENIQKRNIPCPDANCVLCGECFETSDHLFTGCQFSQTVWEIIADWCNIPSFFVFGTNDILKFHLLHNGPKKVKAVIYAVILTTLWSIWNCRNKAIFGNIPPRVTNIVEEIKVMSFLWVRSRSKTSSLSSEMWRRFDLQLFR